MIRRVAFCPHPPLLIPAVAGGAAAELDDLRAACRAAVHHASAGVERLVLIGDAPRAGEFAAGARGSLRAYGVDHDVVLGGPAAPVTDAGAELPLSLTVGAWLVSELAPPVEVRAVAVSDPTVDLDLGAGDTGLLVLGDGSARRSRTAPGYLDDRAEPFDARVSAALAGGDPAALAGLDPALGAELLAAGVPAWITAGRLLAGAAWRARLHYDAAPYGVGYLVADWSRRD